MPVQPNRLLERRLFWGLTQPEVAKAMGIKNYQQYEQWETGEHQPTAPSLEKLAKVFRCSIDYLLGLVDDPMSQFQDTDLDPDEKKLIFLKRQGLVNEAVIHLLGGGSSAPELDNPSRTLIESGDQSEVSGSDPAA